MRWHDRYSTRLVSALAMALLVPGVGHAQHEGHGRPPSTARSDTVRSTLVRKPATAKPGARPTGAAPARPPGGAPAHVGRAHDGAGRGERNHDVPALLGAYPFTREASGTAWQPESAPHAGRHVARGGWSLMAHGFAFAVADRQRGPRGEDRVFSANMFMGRASRRLGPGRLGVRGMMSLEPLTVGKRGYPLLLQTGETADGVTHLIDRQHPHDLFMELAGSWSVSDANGSAFIYAGLPGEPALGPPAFMHRPSGEANPESPIGHHWLDSSHITFGVVTLGLTRERVRLEVSRFHGREPDQDRWNVETGKLDSYSARLTWNPGPDWSLQASGGRIESPEQLDPDTDVDRRTVSAMWSHRGLSALAAWGRNRGKYRPTLDALLLEGAGEIGGRHTLFARAERVEKNELFADGDPRAGEVFIVGRLSAGYVVDLLGSRSFSGGIGALGSVSLVPENLRSVYGDTPLSASLFVRARVR